MNDLQLYADAALAPSGKVALQKLPKQQALWVGGSVGAAALAGATPLWAWAPELALCIALGAGASLVNPRRLWAAPLVIAAVAAVGLACGAIGVPPVVGAGATAGALSASMTGNPVTIAPRSQGANICKEHRSFERPSFSFISPTPYHNFPNAPGSLPLSYSWRPLPIINPSCSFLPILSCHISPS